MPCPRVIPHSDGSGTVDVVGDRVSPEWIGRRVWCYGAQSYRPFGTAAEYTAVPLKQVVQLPERVPLEGACLGIPGIAAHRAVHVAGSVEGRTVLVQGGAGSVGACAVQLAHRAGARVIATCRSESDREIGSRAGADEVLLTNQNFGGTNPRFSSRWSSPHRRGCFRREYQDRYGSVATGWFHCDLCDQHADAGDSGLAACVRERQTILHRQRRCASRGRGRSDSRHQQGT